MKLFSDKKSEDPSYYVQQVFRNGKKTSKRNVKSPGKPLLIAKSRLIVFHLLTI